MNYQQTLDYLFARLPMFQRIGSAAYKADLDNTIKIVELLGKPHQKIKCVHVAGTNGKGSSSHMIASVLQSAGYKTGLYTSPHLVDFRERIKINGKMIPKNYITNFVAKYKLEFEKIEPSFFEWTVGLAFDYFASEEVDIAIIEVGLGGRLDSTNIITPIVSLITNISFDHMNLLGNTLEKIAVEKAGIIKARVPVVISQYQSETAPVFNAKAKELKSPLQFADKNYKIISHKIENDLLSATILNKNDNNSLKLSLDLTGNYQLKNVLGVLNTLNFIEKSGFFIGPESIKKGLSQVTKTTGFQGRWQTISENPLIIVDTGHNEDGIKNVLSNLISINYKQLHFIFGTVNDKDVSKILELLPKNAHYYFTKANIPRALSEDELLEKAKKINLKGKSYTSVKVALEAAKKSYKKNDLILIGGSTFLVGDALAEEKNN